jgi:hypothetical protein
MPAGAQTARLGIRLLMVLLRRLCAWSGLFAGILLLAGPAAASGSAAAAPAGGIRFQIDASIKAAAPARPIYKRGKASLSVRIRISSHATGSQFYGEVTRLFSNVSLADGTPAQTFWRDDACHQRRGLPKTTVIAVDGTVSDGEARYDVHAVARQLGLRLPEDEVAAGSKLPPEFDGRQLSIGFRSETKASLLLVDVKIRQIDCEVPGG